MQRSGRLIAMFAVAACTVAVVPERALACSCSPVPLYSTIPKTGSVGVPLDIAPVLEGPFDPSSLSFTDDAGTKLGFTLALGPEAGCLGGWAEVLPKQPLAPHTRYTIKVNARYPDSLDNDQRVASLSFTTGDSELPDEPLERPHLSAASVMRGAPDCGNTPSILACLGRVKPAEPSHVELLMRRGDEIVLRTTHFIQSDSGFGPLKVPDCIELRRRAIDGRRSEPASICGDALKVSDFTPRDLNANGWVSCRDGLIGAAADNRAIDAGAAPTVSEQDAGIDVDNVAPSSTGEDASVRADDTRDAGAKSDAAASSHSHEKAKPESSSADGCAVTARAPVDFWLLLALCMPLAAARRRRAKALGLSSRVEPYSTLSLNARPRDDA